MNFATNNDRSVKCLQKEPLCAPCRCSFDRRDHGGKNRAQCMWYNDCNVILYLFCFEHFHMVKNPRPLKAEAVRETMMKEKRKEKEAKKRKRKQHYLNVSLNNWLFNLLV